MKKTSKKILAAILAATVCFSATRADAAVGGENAAQVLAEGQAMAGWDGVTTEDTREEKNFKVTFTLAEHWEGGYNARVEIENTGNATVENWMLGFSYAGKITNIWNAVISGQDEDSYIIKNAAWNQDIEAGQSVSFGFSGQENFPGFPEGYRLKGSLESVAGEDYAVSYHVNSEWDNGFTGEIVMANHTGTVLEDWVLEFDFGRTITNIWNGVVESHEGNHYVIRNAGYNSNIPGSGSAGFGFTGQDGKTGDEPSGYKLYSYTDGAGTNDGTGKETGLSINTDGFAYNENAGWYMVDKKTDTLSGTLSAPEKVKDLSCEVTDIKGNRVKSGSISVAENWTLGDFGLSIGYNRVTVTASLESGEKVTAEAAFMNYESSNLDGIDADLSDSDHDGLNNYYESILGTDPHRADTDGDGLSDYDEFIRTGTDPVKTDTDSDGTTDDKEDADRDGLNNLAETRHGTNCFLEDTDGDGLKDGEEIFYHTDPLVADTDQDGLNDREDRELGFDPTKPDTDGNGILDGKEKVLQTCTQKIDTDEKAGITEVSVSLACDGYIDNRVSIMDTYDLDMRSSDVVGLVGVPVDISTDVKFKTAEIKFTYDEGALGDSREDDLCMMWYDEENDNYVMLEDSVLDKENNTITYRTTHFSTYLVVDKQIWLDNLRASPKYADSVDKIHYDIAFAVDASLSMGENGDRLSVAKKALNAFIDAMLPGDRAGLVKFNRNAVVVRGMTEDRELLKAGVESISLAYDNSVAAGIRAGLDMLDQSSSQNEKMLVLICDGDVDDCTALIQEAKEKGVRIFCINVMDGDARELEEIAGETGGIYYFAATSEDIGQVVADLQKDTITSIDMTDSDGDGLYDVYEVNGMRLSNGQTVYTDPDKADSDGDGVSDYDAMGGDPVIESYMIGGNAYSCTLFHSVVYGKLSKKFVYVDGTLNRDGKQYFGKMDYVPYSNRFLYNKYNIKRGEYSGREDNEIDYYFNGEKKTVYGDAGIYNSFRDKLAEMSALELYSYATYGTLTLLAVSSIDSQAADCLYRYIIGEGGSFEGLAEGSTREYIYATPRVETNIFGINSANEYFLSNMNKARLAAESVLNQYNTEVYISLSPETTWCGCAYHDCTELTNWRQNIDSILNIGAFGIYNNADAGITMHCIYDPDEQQYYMEFIYYIIDLYDFRLYDELDQMNALGLARCYELYGVAAGETAWKKSDSLYGYWMY